MRRTLSLLAVGVLTLTGCATDGDGDPSASPLPAGSPTTAPIEPSPDDSPAGDASPTATDEVAAMEFTTCEAPEFTIAHPARWETNEPDDLVAACRVFHPGPVDLPDEPQDRELHWAISVNLDDVAYDDVTGAEPAGEVLEQRETTVAGRDAQVTETRSTGTAIVPEGELRYGYAVDLEAGTLFASTYSVGETDYERDRQVLDRMMSELEITAIASPDSSDTESG